MSAFGAGVAVLPVAAVRGFDLNPGFSMHVAQKWSRFWDNDMHQIMFNPAAPVAVGEERAANRPH
ncbi:hypothetical protein EOA16_29780 [Mesorhizobium sp. M7A.F.Ca.US.008.03.1.1]|nr:hypothetical protein EOA16_29780 [Mesorhizobium sp. M7A.F.Ca.US.008.03.1.1]